MGQLIKAGISRQREFLADASSVQFTRNTAGLVGALKKIGGLAEGSEVQSPRAEEASHMFFGTIDLKPAWFQFLATHPPLLERIERLDSAAVAGLVSTPAHGHAASGAALAAAPGGERLAVSPQQVIAQVGTIDTEHLELSAALLRLLPAEVVQASRDPLGAVSILYALLLDRDAAVRRLQLTALEQRLAPAEQREVLRQVGFLDVMDRTLRLPLADLVLPGLRTLSDAQLRKAEAVISVLAAADGQIDVFEFTLQRLFRRRLGGRLGRTARPKQHFKNLRDVLPDIELCLSVLAAAGHSSQEDAGAAWNRALAQLRGGPASAGALPTWGLDDLGHSISRLSGASHSIKRQFLAAAVSCVVDDGYLAIEEAELLRLFAHSLELPLPPLITPKAA